MPKPYEVYLTSPIIIEANSLNEAAKLAEEQAHAHAVQEVQTKTPTEQ